jgi:cob(I)alamin adenosyltransferase
MSIRINRVYTKSGDDGTTGLVGGSRVSKVHPRVWAYGEIDEVNSILGSVKEELDAETSSLRPLIEYLQQQLFDLGSELATPPGGEYEGMWRTEEKHVLALEHLCDRYGKGLPELRSFILPGGSRPASALHLARSVTRRAERRILELRETEAQDLNPQIVHYVNRLSDLLFVLARWTLAAQGRQAPLWVQEKDRKVPEI